MDLALSLDILLWHFEDVGFVILIQEESSLLSRVLTL
jgi:hypothetical protein